MTKHWAFRISLLAAFCFLLGFTYKYHLPKLETLLLLEVERLTEKHSPIRVWAQKLHFHLIPLGIVLEDVRLLPQKPFAKFMAPARLKYAGAKLAILPLLRGQFRLSELFIRDSELNFFLEDPELFNQTSDGATGAGGPPKVNFDAIYSLPIDEIHLDNIRLQARLPENMVVRLSELDLIVENRFRSLFIDFSAPTVLVKPSGPVLPLEVQAELRTLVEAKEIQVSALKLVADEGFFVASGHFNGDLAKGKLENGVINARAKLDFSSINQWERVFRKPKLPIFSGHGEFDVGVELNAGQIKKVESSLKTEAFEIGKYHVGDINGRVQSDFKSIQSDKLSIQNNSGAAHVSGLHIELAPYPTLRGHVKSEKLDLAQLLVNLGVGKIPVELKLDSEADCFGQWHSKKELECKARVNSGRLFVHGDGPQKPPIVEAHQLRAQGNVKVNLQQVEYDAVLEVGAESKAKTQGVIDYDKGFKITYDAPHVSFKDVKNLANLKFEGEAVLKGNTEGTSDWATIDMKVTTKDFWLEDWPLGQVDGSLKYKAGVLSFPGLQGQNGNSRFNGDVDVDLNKDRIRIRAQLPFVDLKDVHGLFQRKYPMPIEVAGTGSGSLEAEGPFSFRDLTYRLHSNFFRGHLAGESFDRLVFNVRADEGLVKSESIHLTKANGIIDMKGQITRDGQIDSVLVARALRLEQSERVIDLGFDVQGLADMTLLIRGPLASPNIELNGRFSRVIMADQPAEDSIFKLSFLSDRMEGSGQFLGSKVYGDFVIPYSDDGPFLFRMKAKKWDFTNLFSLVSRSAKQLDFETSVSLSVNLQAAKGGFWNSSGTVQFDEFMLRKGATVMKSEKPMMIVARDGVANSSNFAISSGDNYLKLDAVNFGKNNLNASLNGKMDVSLLGLFTPFISDLRGNLSLSVDLRGTLQNPKLSGSAYIDRGYAKFVDFLHPFSNVRADILFNDNQILLNSVRADLASGKVSGDGRIEFTAGAQTVDVKGTFRDVRINIPENFRTRGSGTVAIRGRQFPYVMDINYAVSGGEITYEIGEDVSSSSSVKASAYLPRFLYQEAFHPFTFLIDVAINSPVSVNNSLMQAQINGNVKATGTPDRLLLTGTLTPSPGGKVFFRDQPFDITSAFVEYNNNPPQAPRIYLTATTRASESIQEEGHQEVAERIYDINLLVQGRGPNPEIILSSQPPLSQREIVSLLALGVTTAGIEERKAADYQTANTAAAATSTILQKAGGKRIKETLGVDLKISSSQPTPDTASNPKVTLSKQWTPKFGASASSTLQANPTNNVKLEYKINKNLSAVGSWEGKEAVQEKKNSTQNVFGLDLEYKVNFK